LGLIGCVLFLSFSVLFLILGEFHWALLMLSLVSVALSYRLKTLEYPKVFHHLKTKSRLKPGGMVSIPPSRNAATLVFLLERGEFAIYHENEREWARSQVKKNWEPMPPLLLEDGFLAWSRSGLHSIDYQGQEQGLIDLNGYGVSLLIQQKQRVWMGSTRQEIHCLKGADLESESYPVSGVPFLFFEEFSHLGTSHGVIYDLSDSTPREILPRRSETLAFFPFGEKYCFLGMDHRFYLDDFQSRQLITALNQDFMLPFVRGKRCYLVDRDRRLASMDSEGGLETLREFSLSPLWYKHQEDRTILVFEKGKTVELVILDFSKEDLSVSQFEGEGYFEPLGISDTDLYFSLGSGNWFIWRFSDPKPTPQDSIPPGQVLCFDSLVLTRQGGDWLDANQQTVKISGLEPKDLNYDYQSLGILPLSL